MVTPVQTVETRTEAMRRLLDVARESGVRLGMDSDGDMWATSVSEPGRLYPVTPESCGCRGFAMHRRCRHVAALWSYLGYLDPEPTPPAPASCPTCNGSGEVTGTVSMGQSWRYDSIVCSACHGTGSAVDTAA